jgi:hydroxymethylglutaryl-CoA lyase
MGFGNPYGDAYSAEIVFQYVEQLVQEGVGIISLADTVGVATPQQVRAVTGSVINALPQTEIGVHLHSSAANWREKVDAAYSAGCRRFDGALKGIGGCPMANDALVGNLNTEWLLQYFSEKGVAPQFDEKALEQSLRVAEEIFV